MILFNEAKYLYKCISLLKDKEELLVRDLYKNYFKESSDNISKILLCNPKIFSKLTRIICERQNILLTKKIPWKISIPKPQQEQILKKYYYKFREDIYYDYGLHFNNEFSKIISSKEYIPLENDLKEHVKIKFHCIPQDEEAVQFFRNNINDFEDIAYFVYIIYPNTDVKKLVKNFMPNDNRRIIIGEDEIDLEDHNEIWDWDDLESHKKRENSFIPEWDEYEDSLSDYGYIDDLDFDE